MKPAPDFTLPDQNDTEHTLSQYRGTWVVVYFYPKDNTPGCTKEACSFRDGREELERHNIVVLGISGDSVKSHKKFVDAHNLNFTLLSDPSRDTIRAYGSLGEKSMFGKTYEGILRNTYLISPDGQIAKEYVKVKPEDHAIQIIKDVEALQT
jgi:thioredoxin-dependent peroxiredoxin